MARGKSDGSVIIDTRIDTNGFTKGMADAKKKVSAISASVNKLGESIKNTFLKTSTGGYGKSFQDIQKEILKTEAKLDKLIEKQIRFVETGGNIKSRAFAGMEYDIEMTRNRLEELRTQLSLASKEAPKKIGKMEKWTERLKKSFGSLNNTVKKSRYSMLRMLGTSLLFSTVFRAISVVTKGFTEGINNIALYSDKANKTMSTLKSSLTQMKNSFATAFMPIITVATPILTQFMGILSKVTSTVAAFISALTGSKTYIKAIEVQEDYAASLDKTANSAKKAQKYLSGLDEIRTFTEKDGGANGVVSPENMFKEEKIDTPILDFAKKIKEIFKNQDWSELGEYLSDGISNGISGIAKKIKDTDFKKIGNKIGSFLKGIKWKDVFLSVGNFLEEAINAAYDLWKGSFDANPIATTIITALGVASFTGVGDVLWDAIKKDFSATVLGKSIGFTPTVLIAAITWEIGFNVGKSLGKALFPEDAKWYDEFEWFGENGFFDTIFGTDMETHFEAIRQMSNDFGGLIGIMDKLKISITGNKLEFKDLFWGLDDLITKAKPLIKDWYNDHVKPWFTKEKWIEAMGGIKEAFDKTWKGAVNIAIDLLNKFIDYINDKMHFEWDGLSIMGKEIFPSGSMQLFTIPKIPMLASGAVIPPNAPFMAMLGDQRHGTNIEAPLDTIKQAVREVVGTNNSGGQYQFTAQLNRRVIFDEIIEEARLRQTASGRNVFMTL